MDRIQVKKIDETNVGIDCSDSGIHHEIWDFFSFKMENSQWHPKVRSGQWDGIIKLYDRRKKFLPYGLVPRLVNFAENRNYSIELDSSLIPEHIISEDYGYELAKKLESPFPPRDFQNDAVVKVLNERRGLILSPTGSGKSFMIYLATCHHLLKDKKVLLVVPTVSLVRQMQDDFTEYNNGQSIGGYEIYSGVKKSNENELTISTWQSIYKQSEDWFSAFDVVIIDEVHEAEAKSITELVKKCSKAKHKYGLTGTLKDSKTHKLALEGLFGPVIQAATTSELIEKGILANLKIDILMLEHTLEVKKSLPKTKDYMSEMKLLINNRSRNSFIKNLASKLDGNTLVLFQFVEEHGIPLFEIFSELDTPVHLIHGGIKAEQRNLIRKQVIESEKNIILASFGTYQRGINIPNLNNLILGSPGKSKIRNLQSIGRILRVSEGKTHARLFDIADDLRVGKKPNFGLQHLNERIDIYSREGFDFDLHTIKLKG